MRRVFLSTCYGVAVRKFPWVILGISLVLVAVDAFGIAGTGTHASALHMPTAMRSSFDLNLASTQIGLFASTYQAALPALIAGILIGNSEMHRKGYEYAQIAEPRRLRLAFARILASALVGLAISSICVLLVDSGVLIFMNSRSIRLAPTLDLTTIILSNMLVVVAYALIGCAVGLAVRSRIAALTGTLLWFLVFEAAISTITPNVGRWTIGEASRTLINLDAFNIASRQLLPIGTAAVLLLTYLALGLSIALIVNKNRDFA